MDSSPEPDYGLRDLIVNKIRKWFKEEEYTVEEVSSPTAYFDANFDANVYHVTKTGHRTTPFYVKIPNDSIDKILVGTLFGYKITEKSSDFFKDVDKANKLGSSLNNILDWLNVNFSVNEDPEEIEIDVSKTIYFDGFSKHVLFETKDDILTAYRVLDLTYKRTMKEYDISEGNKK